MRRLAGHDIGPIGLGCMSFGGIYGATDEAESFACMQAALDLGVDHWDVAEIYGALGVLEKGHLVETDRSGLVAEYAGQTGPKTNAKVDEALDTKQSEIMQV